MNHLYFHLTQLIAEKDLLLIHFVATCYMMGLIWFVQLVHYPLFKLVGEKAHLTYHRAHVFWTTWAVGPAMIIEAITATSICFSPNLPRSLCLCGGFSLAIVWLSTALIQVPCHDKLSRGFDPHVHQRLVRSNWIRCIGWSLRVFIAVALLR